MWEIVVYCGKKWILVGLRLRPEIPRITPPEKAPRMDHYGLGFLRLASATLLYYVGWGESE
jgi:hypothetical protein